MEITTFVLGEMPEWSNGPDSKSGVLLAVPGVRIPFSPPNEKRLSNVGNRFSFILCKIKSLYLHSCYHISTSNSSHSRLLQDYIFSG